MSVIAEEIIGKKTRVIKSTNRTLVNIVGTIRDETKYTLTIETEKGPKKIPKKNTTFLIDNEIVEGITITKNPVERTKL